MATVARGTKAVGGGTDFAGGTILKAEVNTDFNTLYNDYNGNIADVNLMPGANVALSKLGDDSATAAAQATTTTPGDSAGQILPTVLTGELQQIRHILEMHGLGIDADRVDGAGTGTTFWGDRPARMVNLIKNPNFTGGVAATTVPPTGWADLGTGTPTFAQAALTGATLTEGKGVEATVTAGSAAVAGMTQTLHLKASTRYLVVVRSRSGTNAAHVKTTGADATSSFRNIDDTNATTTYTTTKGVIQTDSTPTNIVIQLTTAGASGDAAKFAFCGVYECSADLLQIGPTPWVVATNAGPVLIDSTVFTDLGVSAQVYANDGQQIEVHVDVPAVRATGGDVWGLKLMENVAGGGAAEVAYTEARHDANVPSNIRLSFIRQAPVPGSSYVYTAEARTAGGTLNCPGATAVTAPGTKRIELRVRAVRVSQ